MAKQLIAYYKQLDNIGKYIGNRAELHIYRNIHNHTYEKNQLNRHFEQPMIRYEYEDNGSIYVLRLEVMNYQNLTYALIYYNSIFSIL